MEDHHQEIETLLAYLRAELSAPETAALEKRLMDDEALRRQLLELSAEEMALTDWAKNRAYARRSRQ